VDDLALRYYLDDFRNHISDVRTQLALSTAEMCERLNITRQTLSNYETERGNFSLVNALAVSAVFDFLISQNPNFKMNSIYTFEILRVDVVDYVISCDDYPSIDSLTYAWQRKLATRSQIHLDNLYIGESLFKYKLFLDLLSYDDDEQFGKLERFFYRIIEMRPSGANLDLYIHKEDLDREQRLSNKRVIKLLGLLKKAKENGVITLFPLDETHLSFGDTVQVHVRGHNYMPGQCAVLSANATTLNNEVNLIPILLSIDGTPLSLENELDALKRYANTHTAEHVIGNNSVTGNNLLEDLFDKK